MKARRGWKILKGALRQSGKVVVSRAFFGVAALLIACTASTSAHTEEEGATKTGNPLWGISLADLRMTVERPLFSPSRRPPPPPIPPAITASALPPPAIKPKPPPLELLGTIVGERSEIAVFLDETTHDTVRLKVGQDHRGWTLRSVHRRQVDLEKDRRFATLSFKPNADTQRPFKPDLEKPLVDLAASNTPDMESYRAALRQRRGR